MRSNFEVGEIDGLTDEGSQFSLRENFQVDDMLATIKASARSFQSDGPLPSLTRIPLNAMVIEEIIEDEPPAEEEK